MFDTVTGLPVHALVVHAVVAFLPLAAVLTVAAVLRPSWRGVLRWVVVADAVVVVVAFAAQQSGEQLQARLSQARGHPVAQEHAELGGLLPLFALLLLAAAAFAWFGVRRGGVLVPLSVAGVVLAALASVGVTFAVGHSGATATWQEEIAGTSAPVGDADG